MQYYEKQPLSNGDILTGIALLVVFFFIVATISIMAHPVPWERSTVPDSVNCINGSEC
jgi:hypothetical protein